jgi:hypothetical protein
MRFRTMYTQLPSCRKKLLTVKVINNSFHGVTERLDLWQTARLVLNINPNLRRLWLDERFMMLRKYNMVIFKMYNFYLHCNII